jgi:hypothetical protein
MSSRSGGLLELVARGKKDVFFTSNPVVSFFHSVYTRISPFSKEIYIAAPRNAPDWGRWVDFDIEHRGDLIRDTYLRITLPTWLPSDVVPVNKTGLVTDASGITFGYCNNVGFQMIDKIQLFIDQTMVCETYGEYLEWKLRQSYSLSSTSIIADNIGSRPETPLAIGRSATATDLRVPITMLGYQDLHDPGLPLTAMKNQRFRLRVYIRKLEEIVVASDGRLNPAPWDGKPLRVQATAGGTVVTSQKTLPYNALKLCVNLETTHVYVPADVNLWLRSQTLRFPYKNIQFNQFTIEDNQLNAASTGIVFHYPCNVDMTGSIERMLLGFRSDAASQAGQRTDLRPPAPAQRFITQMRLNIANIDRIRAWTPAVFREVTAYWKSPKMALDLVNNNVPAEIYTLTFGGYDRFGPYGTINFTRAALPVLYLTLGVIPYDPRNISRKTIALLYGEAWNIWEIRGGYGKPMFDE